MSLDTTKLQLVGCGILQKEIRFLIAKNHWSIATDFLPSSLHINFKQLEHALQKGLARHTNEQTIVFYGACHPRMDTIIEQAGTLRTIGQNCVAMLLGEDEFNRELLNGAFFLLDDWVQHWDKVMLKTFGTNIDIIRDIFHEQHRYLLALRTPCSDDYSQDAQRISKLLELPLQWRDVTLDHLEKLLQTTMQQKLDALSCQMS
jgi:hypothetical protein